MPNFRGCGFCVGTSLIVFGIVLVSVVLSSLSLIIGGLAGLFAGWLQKEKGLGFLEILSWV
jgi:hypothetical protein